MIVRVGPAVVCIGSLRIPLLPVAFEVTVAFVGPVPRR